MPEFLPSAVKAATLSLSVSPNGVSCTVELFLTKDGVTKAATSGPVSFVSTGAVQNVLLSITMPSVSDTYLVYIDVLSGGTRVGAYQATDNVIVMVPQLPFTYTFSCTKGICPGATAYGITVMSGTIKNNNSVLVSQNVKVMWSRYRKLRSDWAACAGGVVPDRENCVCSLGKCKLNPFTVSLAPGEQQSFSYKGYCSSDEGPGFENCYPMLALHYRYYFWLEDDAGGKSNEVIIST